MNQSTGNKLLAAGVPGDRIMSNNLSGLTIDQDADLYMSILKGVNLQGTVFKNLDLRNANFIQCDMRNASFTRCRMDQADFRNLDAEYANFDSCRLVGARFKSVILRQASFYRADLRDSTFATCDVEFASFGSAVLTNANFSLTNIEKARKDYLTIGLHPAPEGDLIGYGKKSDFIVTLLIPKEARRSCATSRKYRAEYAKVLSIESLFGAPGPSTVTNQYYVEGCLKSTRYTVGEYVYPDAWDEDRWNECSNGIHFWLTKEEARQW